MKINTPFSTSKDFLENKSKTGDSFFRRTFLRFEKVLFLVMSFFPFVLFSQSWIVDSTTACIKLYEYQKAINLINKADISNSTYSTLLEFKANSLKALNKYPEAISQYQTILKKDSTNITSLINLATCFSAISDYKNAQKYFLKSLKIRPHNAFLIQKLADAYYQNDEYKKAIDTYFLAFSNDSTFYITKQLAQCFDKLEQQDTAIYYYHKAVILNPQDSKTVYRLANLHKQTENYPEAINITESYLQIDSLNIRMLKLNGFLYFLNKHPEMAIKSFEKCIELNDTSDFTTKYLGYSYYKNENYLEAKDYLERSFLKDTSNIDLCYALGISCDYSIYKKLAIKYLNKTIELATPSPEFLSKVYQDLAIANEGYCRFDDALHAFLKAYEINPNDTLLIFKIASYYDNRTTDKKSALKYYQIFMETRPKNRKPLPKMPGVMVVSYYDYVEKRMGEIKEELFWNREKPEKSVTEEK